MSAQLAERLEWHREADRRARERDRERLCDLLAEQADPETGELPADLIIHYPAEDDRRRSGCPVRDCRGHGDFHQRHSRNGGLASGRRRRNRFLEERIVQVAVRNHDWTLVDVARDVYRRGLGHMSGPLTRQRISQILRAVGVEGYRGCRGGRRPMLLSTALDRLDQRMSSEPRICKEGSGGSGVEKVGVGGRLPTVDELAEVKRRKRESEDCRVAEAKTRPGPLSRAQTAALFSRPTRPTIDALVAAAMQ